MKKYCIVIASTVLSCLITHAAPPCLPQPTATFFGTIVGAAHTICKAHEQGLRWISQVHYVHYLPGKLIDSAGTQKRIIDEYKATLPTFHTKLDEFIGAYFFHQGKYKIEPEDFKNIVEEFAQKNPDLRQPLLEEIKALLNVAHFFTQVYAETPRANPWFDKTEVKKTIQQITTHLQPHNDVRAYQQMIFDLSILEQTYEVSVP